MIDTAFARYYISDIWSVPPISDIEYRAWSFSICILKSSA